MGTGTEAISMGITQDGQLLRGILCWQYQGKSAGEHPLGKLFLV